MKVVRAHDGFSIDLKPELLDGLPDTGLASFQEALAPVIAVPDNVMIIMNNEGSLLKDESIPHVITLVRSAYASGSGSQSFEKADLSVTEGDNRIESVGSPTMKESVGSFGMLYVFRRDFLDVEVEHLARELYLQADEIIQDAVQPAPPSNFEDPDLDVHLRSSEAQLNLIHTLAESLRYQSTALSTAVRNMSLLVSSTSSSFRDFQLYASVEMQKCGAVLSAYEVSMTAADKVQVAKPLLGVSPKGKKEEQRVLGNYVNKEKMAGIVANCSRIYQDLKSRFDSVEGQIKQALESTDVLIKECENKFPSDLNQVEKLGRETYSQIEELAERQNKGEIDSVDLEHLASMHNASIARIKGLIQTKNTYTCFVLETLQLVSQMQTGISETPQELARLDEDLRTKLDPFKHLSRLRDLIAVYVATVLEIVRRREFARLLSKNSHAVANLLSKLSSSERTRRLNYRSEYGGKLPWQIPGLSDEPEGGVPVINVELRESLENVGRSKHEPLPDLDRSDVEALAMRLQEIHQEVQDRTSLPPSNPVQDARTLLDRLQIKIDTMERDFERALLGGSNEQFEIENRPPMQTDHLEGQIRALEDVKHDLERQLQAERGGREQECTQLITKNAELASALDTLRSELSRARAEVSVFEDTRQADASRHVKETHELRDASERARTDIALQLESARKRAEEAEDDLRDRISQVDNLHEELLRARSDLGTLKTESRQNEKRYSETASQLSNVSAELARTQSAVQDLKSKLSLAAGARSQLEASVADRDKLFKDQEEEWTKELEAKQRAIAFKQEEIDREQREAETVARENTRLKEEIRNLKEQHQRQFRDSKTSSDSISARNKVLESELTEVRKQYQDSDNNAVVAAEKYRRQIEQLRRERDDAAARAVSSDNRARDALGLAKTLYDGSTKIRSAVNTIMTVSKTGSSMNGIRPPSANLPDEPSRNISIETNGVGQDLLMGTMSSLDINSLAEQVQTKVELLTRETRKWQKECKYYRSTLGERIAFRNFSKGDIALFLPTRNTQTQNWAAFNVNSPGYFLRPSGEIAEQIKSKEWVLAKITGITEKVVDPESRDNPFSLVPGTKYFLLDVETWSPRRQKRRLPDKHRTSRSHSSRKTSNPTTEPSSAPEPEPEPLSAATEPAMVSSSAPESSGPGFPSHFAVPDGTSFESADDDLTPQLRTKELDSPTSRDVHQSRISDSFISERPTEIEFPGRETLALPQVPEEEAVPSPPSLDGFSRISVPRSSAPAFTPAFLPSARWRPSPRKANNSGAVAPKPQSPTTTLRRSSFPRSSSTTGSAASSTPRSAKSGNPLFPAVGPVKPKAIATTSTTFEGPESPNPLEDNINSSKNGSTEDIIRPRVNSTSPGGDGWLSSLGARSRRISQPPSSSSSNFLGSLGRKQSRMPSESDVPERGESSFQGGASELLRRFSTQTPKVRKERQRTISEA